jgi:hypothetical protein
MLLCHSPLGNASSEFLPTIFGVLALSRGPRITNFDSTARQETSLVHEPGEVQRAQRPGRGARAPERGAAVPEACTAPLLRFASFDHTRLEAPSQLIAMCRAVPWRLASQPCQTPR